MTNYVYIGVCKKLS